MERFKKTFENRLLEGWGLFCTKVSIVRVIANHGTYKFLRLDGNNGKKGAPPFDMPEEDISMFFLITKNRFLRKRTVKNDDSNYLGRNMHARFGTAKKVAYDIEQEATNPSPSTCMSMELNHTTQTGYLLNISVHDFCNLVNMDEVMTLMDALLKKVDWKGTMLLSDNALKNGVRVAVYYMRKHADDPNKFSKYQDYGFQVQSKNVLALQKLKKAVVTMTDKAATKKYNNKLSELLMDMYRPNPPRR